MKINLLIAASFLALGALLTSPLHAMEDFDKENKGKGGNSRQIRSEISTRLFLEVPKISEFNSNLILKVQGSENAVHDLKKSKKAFHDLEQSFKNNQMLKLQGNEKAVHDLEQSFEKVRLLFLEVPKSSEVDNSQTLKLRGTYSTENSSGTI